MGFHVGQLVVCVKTGEWRDSFYNNEKFPARNVIYTVREVDQWPDGDDGIRLQEIVNPLQRYRGPHGQNRIGECSFAASRFRPIDENRIEVFRQIAASPKERIRIGEDA